MTTQETLSIRSSSTIPVIDFGACAAGVPGAASSTARELRHALEDVGFFVMTGHGVPQSLIDQTFSEARRFHDQAERRLDRT